MKKEVSVLLDCREFIGPDIVGGFLGKILASEPGVARVRIVTDDSEAIDPFGHHTNHVVGVVSFDPDELAERGAYIVIRQEHYNDLQLSTVLGLKFEPTSAKWRPIAGEIPDWLKFPLRWRNWISDPKVRTSALQHIYKLGGRKIEEIFKKRIKPTSLLEHYEFWMSIAQTVLTEEAVEKLKARTTARGLNGLAVAAMLIRITNSLGGWQPPLKWVRFKPAPKNLCEIIPELPTADKVTEPLLMEAEA